MTLRGTVSLILASPISVFQNEFVNGTSYPTGFCLAFEIFQRWPSLVTLLTEARGRGGGGKRVLATQLWNSLPRKVCQALTLEVFRRTLETEL